MAFGRAFLVLVALLLAVPAAAEPWSPSATAADERVVQLPREYRDACTTTPTPLPLQRQTPFSPDPDQFVNHPVMPSAAFFHAGVQPMKALLMFQPGLPVLDLRRDSQFSRRGFEILVRRPATTAVTGKDSAEPWDLAFYHVYLLPRRGVAGTGHVIPASVAPPRAQSHPLAEGVPDDQVLGLRFEFPWDDELGLFQFFDIVVVPCLRAHGHSLLVFAESFGLRPGVFFVSATLATLLGLAVAAALWLVWALVAWRATTRHLIADRASGRMGGLLRLLHPRYVFCDSSGHMSLAALQSFLALAVILGLVVYIFAMTGRIPTLSPSILTLLGVVFASSAASVFLVRTGGLSEVNRDWLLEHGVLRFRKARPEWTDLFAADGQPDITRIQAVFFLGLVLVALVWTGHERLDRFDIDPALWQLVLGSQGVYLVGKGAPSLTMRALDSQVSRLREAHEEALSRDAMSPSPKRALLQSRLARLAAALRIPLEMVFPGLFSRDALERLARA